MATSPNYGWAEPDNSSLVKNGAQDIRALGDAIDTSVWNVGYGQAAKNKLINSDFRFNQRNFTSTTSNGTYGFDRWYFSAVDGTSTYSAQTFTPGAAPVAGYEAINYARLVSTGQTLGSALTQLRQPIEDVRTLSGSNATVSFWAKAATGTPKIAIEWNQQFGSGGSPSSAVQTYAGQVTLSTSWVRYSVTVAVPSMSGKTIGTTANTSYVALNLFTSAGSDYNARTGTLGIQSATIDIWGVQVEYGSKATPFQTATGTIQGELAACQRYYWRDTGASNSPTIPVSYQVNSLTIGGNNPVAMRISPSVSATYTNATYGTAWSVSQPTRAACTKTGTVSNNYFSTPLTWGLTYDGGTFTPSPSAFQGSASNYFEASAEL